jgi:hypothetical protein
MAPTSSSHAYSPTAKEPPTPSPRQFHPQTIQPSRQPAKRGRHGRLRSPSHPQPCNKSLSPPRKSSTSPPQSTQPIPEDPDHDSSPNPHPLPTRPPNNQPHLKQQTQASPAASPSASQPHPATESHSENVPPGSPRAPAPTPQSAPPPHADSSPPPPAGSAPSA